MTHHAQDLGFQDFRLSVTSGSALEWNEQKSFHERKIMSAHFSHSLQMSFFKWAIPGLFILYFCLFNTQLTVNKCSIYK